MNSNIFQISNDYLELIATIEDNDGELTPELEEALSINKEELDAKMEAYAHIIKQKQADMKLAKDEIDRLRDLMKRDEKTIDRLKGVLIDTMDIFGLRNKNGNLAYRLPTVNMFTRNIRSIDVKIEAFGMLEEEAFAEFLDFNITSKLTREQFIAIQDKLAELGLLNIDHTIVASKTKIKEALETLNIIEDEQIREERLDLISELAQYKDSVSLTIR